MLNYQENSKTPAKLRQSIVLYYILWKKESILVRFYFVDKI